MKDIHIQQVVENELCCGCGACAAAWPDQYKMTDIVRVGRRPSAIRESPPVKTMERRERAPVDSSAVCPGIELRHTFDPSDPEMIHELRRDWGPVYEVWEGFAADPEIRRLGSSGGAATALALYCIEKSGMHGALHTAARDDRPYLNETMMSRTREELLAATGSRYAPASPCEGLGRIENAPAPCVFIGKPCDVAGAQKLRKLKPELDANLGLTIAFFCAGTPSTQGTLDLLAKAGIEDPDSVTNMRYRGNGWPGRWEATYKGGDGQERSASMSYEESWGFLQRYRQWRCYICPDHTGEFADIAVGDPWYRAPEGGEPGRSLLIVRTRHGREVLRQAVAAGYVTLRTSDPSLLGRSQPNLLRTRGRLWGQLVALRLAGKMAPRYYGFPVFHRFLRLPLKTKAKSLFGTVSRYQKCLRNARPRRGANRVNAV